MSPLARCVTRAPSGGLTIAVDAANRIGLNIQTTRADAKDLPCRITSIARLRLKTDD